MSVLTKLNLELRENANKLFTHAIEKQIEKAEAESKALCMEIADCENRGSKERAEDLRFQNTLLYVEMEVLERQEQIIATL